MDSAEKKEYLKQYRAACARTDIITAEIQTLNARLRKVTASYNSFEGRSGSHETDKMTSGTARLIELKEKLQNEICELAMLRDEIASAIDGVDEERLRLLLYRRYILGQRWERIAADMNRDIRWIYRMHGRALQKLEVPKVDH